MLDDPTGYGRIVRNARGAIQKIVEQKDASKAQLKIREGNSGIMAVPAKLLRKWLGKLKNANSQGEYYLTDVIEMAVKEKVKVTPLIAPTTAETLGVNDKCSSPSSKRCIAPNARANSWSRARRWPIRRASMSAATSRVGRDVFLDANVLLEGKVTLGDRVRVGPNIVLRDVSIGADTVIHPNSVLEQSELGAGCIIGPFARVRPGSKLGAGVHIGNFVELKKTVIADGSKANHLTYLGDAVIGKGVNVGAGTITCNYDGVNKSTTTIEDGAFIGSGNMLVAPVRIGKDATTGAGSTITKDAPDGQLTIARGKQMTVEGWKRPEKKAQVNIPRLARGRHRDMGLVRIRQRLRPRAIARSCATYSSSCFQLVLAGAHIPVRGRQCSRDSSRARDPESDARRSRTHLRGGAGAQQRMASCSCSIATARCGNCPADSSTPANRRATARARELAEEAGCAARNLDLARPRGSCRRRHAFRRGVRLRCRRRARSVSQAMKSTLSHAGAAGDSRPRPLGESDAALLNRFG